MRIVILGSPEERQTIRREAKDVSVKFAIFATERGEQLLHLFSTHTQHSHYVGDVLKGDSGLTLVGAGFVRTGIAEWNSSSCRDQYGFDRPEALEQQRELLGAIRDAVFTSL